MTSRSDAQLPRAFETHLWHRLAEIADCRAPELLELAARPARTQVERFDRGLWLALVRELRVLGLDDRPAPIVDELVWRQAHEAVTRAWRLAAGSDAVENWVRAEQLAAWVTSEQDWHDAVAARGEHLLSVGDVPEFLVGRRIEHCRARAVDTPSGLDELTLTLDDGVVLRIQNSTAADHDGGPARQLTVRLRAAGSGTAQRLDSERVARTLRWRTVAAAQADGDTVHVGLADGAAVSCLAPGAEPFVWLSPLDQLQNSEAA